MSYRLIDSNTLAMGCAEVNDMPCIYADLPNGLDGGHYDIAQSNADKSRWFELFGTPKRAARTLEEFELDQLNWCRGTEYCENCPYEFDRYGCYLPDGFELLEWLRGDA